MKRSALLLFAISVILLTSCGASVEDLLVAPSLTADQSAILSAIREANTERTMLKYPISGEWRTPIQFLDFNNDGVEEAVVFYSAAPEVNARIAVLEKAGGTWSILSELPGGGPEVNSVQILSGVNTNLLVEWGSVNPSNRQFAVYNYENNALRVGFNEECSDILMEDFSGSGMLEFCYVTAMTPDEPFRIVYTDDSGGQGYTSSTEIELRHEMVALLSLKARKDAERRHFIYVDAVIEGNRTATEVFTIEKGEFARLELEMDLDISLLSVRRNDLICRGFPGVRNEGMMIPSEAPPRETIVDESLWTFWYHIENVSLSHEFTSYVNMALNLNIGVPEEWPDRVVVVESEEDQRLFVFSDVNAGEVLFEIKVLRVEDNPGEYESEGFQTIQRGAGGVYRYLYRAGRYCTAREEWYIVENFYGIIN